MGSLLVVVRPCGVGVVGSAGNVQRMLVPAPSGARSRSDRRGTRRSSCRAPGRCRCPRRRPCGCSRWKITKTRSAYCWSMPMPLSATRASSQESPTRRALDVDRRAAVGAAELDARCRRGSGAAGRAGARSPRTDGQLVVRDDRARCPRPRSLSWSSAVASASVQVDVGRAPPPTRPTRENAEQVLDEPLHALGAVDGELDVLVGALVELAAVPLLQELGEAGHLAQRLLQVVRRDVGELLEVAVRAHAAPRPARSAARWPRRSRAATPRAPAPGRRAPSACVPRRRRDP